MIIDATDLIVGRIGTVAAKKALLGEKIDIVNCEKAVISGSRSDVIGKFMQKIHRKTVAHGPYVSRMPDRMTRRIIRGMLPYKKEKGRIAFKKIMCYIGIPDEFKGKKMETLKEADVKERQTTKYVTMADVCKQLGANI